MSPSRLLIDNFLDANAFALIVLRVQIRHNRTSYSATRQQRCDLPAYLHEEEIQWSVMRARVTAPDDW